MSLRTFFGGGKKVTEADGEVLLTVSVNEQPVAKIHKAQVPCEVTPDVPIDGPATIDFTDAAGQGHRHHVPADGGWLHLSVRVHANFGCQADAVVTARPDHQAGAAIGDGETAMRFQPFFLAGATSRPDLTGSGMFARGLHFSGLVTPGNILLSCECDQCRQSFVVGSFHAGFSNLGYFYSESGLYTLTVDAGLPGAPAALTTPDPDALASLEAQLPPAPDGTRFAYRNGFRCPHCRAPFIDFDAHPEQRPGEYYGLYLPDRPPIRFTPAQDQHV